MTLDINQHEISELAEHVPDDEATFVMNVLAIHLMTRGQIMLDDTAVKMMLAGYQLYRSQKKNDEKSAP